jgi:nucleoside-diphosphate-sugar epimerase
MEMDTAHKKILVIGAGGQLGSELTQGLWDRYGKENVIATDIKEPEGVLAEGNFDILDATNHGALHVFLQKNAISQIYHLAAVLSAKGEQNPRLAWKLNMDSLLYVLDAAVEFKIPKVYWPSSIAVFGPNTPKVMTPQHTTMEPTTIYGISKLAGERWCAWYHNKYGVDVRSIRYPGLIGYKSRAGGGTTDYAVDIYFKAVENKMFTCFLKPDTYLPMMYMEDAIKATLQLMEAPANQIKVRSGYNLSAMSFCPENIYASIKNHIPDFKIQYDPDYRQAIADSWPNSIDDSGARNDWGWKPEFGLDNMTEVILAKLRRVPSTR